MFLRHRTQRGGRYTQPSDTRVFADTRTYLLGTPGLVNKRYSYPTRVHPVRTARLLVTWSLAFMIAEPGVISLYSPGSRRGLNWLRARTEQSSDFSDCTRPDCLSPVPPYHTAQKGCSFPNSLSFAFRDASHPIRSCRKTRTRSDGDCSSTHFYEATLSYGEEEALPCGQRGARCSRGDERPEASGTFQVALERGG